MATGRSPSTKLPWWNQDQTVMQFQRRIAAAQEAAQSLSVPALRVMKARAFVSTVMVSCEVDNVPPHILSPEEIFRHLTSLYEEILHHCPPNQRLKSFQLHIFETCNHHWSWQFSGYRQSNKLAFFSQLAQHLKALMFLCIYHHDEPLDVQLPRHTHFILMSGYKDASEPYMQPGSLRDTPLHSNGAAFIHESAIGLNIKDMLCRLHGKEDGNSINVHGNDDGNLSRQSPPPCNLFNFPERCATLLHDMTHIHPFLVGQEWMCRLMMAHFMVSHDRLAFPVPIAPITHRTSEEFLRALSAPDDDELQLHADFAHGFQREKALLSAYILECVCESLEELMNG